MPYAEMEGTSFFAFTQPIFQLILDKDIAVVQRCYSQAQYNFIRACRNAGMKVIMDLDDDMWHIPPHNPAYEMLGKCKQGFAACMQIVDVITVSTKPLARIVQSIIKKTPKPVIIAENRISTRLFARPRKKNEITVGWGGSLSHQGFSGQRGTGDLGLVEEAIADIAAEEPDVIFEFRGAVPDPTVFRTQNVHHHAGVPVAEYAARMPVWGWHIALAPLTADEFNQSKSCIKMVEAGYCGIPCLASSVEPYDRFASFDAELRWLLCHRPADWAQKLRILIHEPERREELGQRMHRVTMQHFSMSKEHEGWQAAFAAARKC